MWTWSVLMVVAGLGMSLLLWQPLSRSSEPVEKEDIRVAAMLGVLPHLRSFGDVSLREVELRSQSTGESWEAYGVASTLEPVADDHKRQRHTKVSYQVRGRSYCQPGIHPDCTRYDGVRVLVMHEERILP